jgi:hypothetical protein
MSNNMIEVKFWLLVQPKAALPASSLAASFGNIPLILEGDFLIVIMTINNQSLFFDWQIAPVIRSIILLALSLSLSLLGHKNFKK